MDLDDDEPEAKRGGAGKIILAVGALVLVAGLAIGGILFFNPFGGKTENSNNGGGDNNIVKVDHTTDHKFLPDNSDFVFSLKFAQVLNSAAVNTLRKEIPMVEGALGQMKDAKREIGVDLEDIQTVTIGGLLNKKDSPVALMNTATDYTAEKLLNNRNKQGQAAPLKEGTYTIYVIDAQQAFCVVNKKQILFGPSKSLQEILKRNGPPTFSNELQSAIKSVDFSNPVVAAADFKELKNLVPVQKQPGGRPTDGKRDQKLEGPPPGNGGPGMGMAFPDPPEYGAVEISLSNQIHVKGYGFYKDAKPADDTAKLINGFLAVAKMQKDIPPSIIDLLNGIQLSAKDTTLTAQITLTSNTIVALTKDAGKIGAIPGLPPEVLAMLGGGAPKPPPPPTTVELMVGNPHAFKVGPNQTQDFKVFCKGQNVHNLNVKSIIPSKLTIQVLQKGENISFSGGLDAKTDHTLNWSLKDGDFLSIRVINVDPLTHDCNILVKEETSAPPKPAIIVKKDGPFKENKTFGPGDKLVYEIQAKASDFATFDLLAPPGGARFEIKVLQDGKVIQQDAGQKESFKLVWRPTVPGQYSVELVYQDKAEGKVDINFAQVGTPVVGPPVGDAIKKDGPFKEMAKFPKDKQVVYRFPVKGNQEATFQANAKLAILMVVKLEQNGTVLAEDKGVLIRNIFMHKWTPPSDGFVTAYITPKEPTNEDWEISFTQGVSTPSIPGAIVKAGPFTESLKIKPKDKIVYEVPVKSGQMATFSLKPLVDISAEIKVTQSGVTMAQDRGTKTSFDLNWTPTAAGNAVIEIVSSDEFTSSCTASLSQKEGPPPPEVVGNLIGQPSPFMSDFTIGANDTFTFKIPVQAGRAGTFHIKGKNQDVNMDVKIYQKGNLVASKSGAFREADLTWTPAESSFAFVQFNVSANNQEKNCFFSFIQSGDLPPALGNLIKKDGPFTWDVKISPGDKFSIQLPVKAGGTGTFRYQSKSGDANLDLKVYQADKLVAQKEGFHKDFVLNWNPDKAGDVMMHVVCNDTRNLDGVFSFTQDGGAAPPVGGGNVIKKNGPFTENVNFKPNEPVTFEFPIQAGPNQLEIKPTFGGKLDIKVMQNGMVAAQDVGGGIKSQFVIRWTASAPGMTQVNVVCVDQFTLPATVTFSNLGGGGNPPPGTVVLNGPQQGVPVQSNGIIANGQPVLYSIPLQAGTKYIIKMNSAQVDSYLELMDPNGTKVAQDDDSGGFPNAKIVYTPNVTGNFQIKCRTFGGGGNGAFTLIVEQDAVVGGNPANSVTKPAPFTDVRTIKAGESFAYRVPVKIRDQLILGISQQKIANLDIKVIGGGKQLAVDSGPKDRFSLNIEAPKSGICTIQITNNDKQDSDCTVTVGTINGPPPAGGGGDYSKKGTLSAKTKSFTHTHSMQAGVPYKISGTAAFFLHLEVKDAGKVLVQQSFPGGVGTITFTPTATKSYQITIRDALNSKGGAYTLNINK